MDEITFIINKDGSQRWVKNNKPHREDGPSDVYSSGVQLWYKDGKRQWTK